MDWLLGLHQIQISFPLYLKEFCLEENFFLFYIYQKLQ